MLSRSIRLLQHACARPMLRYRTPTLCWQRQAARCVAGFPEPKYEDGSSRIRDSDKKDSVDTAEDAPEWLKTFNERMSKDLVVTIPVFLVVRNGTWYGLAFLYSQYFSFGPEFAVAYLMVKLTGKFRRPVDIALAAVLSKAFPILSQVKVSALFSPPAQDEAVKGTAIGKAMAWMQGPMDKYGFSFYLACKLTSFASIAGTAAAIKYGVDISSALTYFGVPDMVQDASAAFGVATLTNIALIPVHFAMVSAIVPTVGKVVAEIRESRKQ